MPCHPLDRPPQRRSKLSSDSLDLSTLWPLPGRTTTTALSWDYADWRPASRGRPLKDIVASRIPVPSQPLLARAPPLEDWHLDATVIVGLALSFAVVLGLDSWPVMVALWMLAYCISRIVTSTEGNSLLLRLRLGEPAGGGRHAQTSILRLSRFQGR